MYWWLSKLINGNLFQLIYVNVTDVERYIDAVTLVLYTYPNINVILLGLGFAIQYEIRYMQTRLWNDTVSKEIYNSKIIFSTLKVKYENIWDVVIYIDETFPYFIAIC